MKKILAMSLTIASFIILAGLPMVSRSHVLSCGTCGKGVVDKKPCETFTVEIEFQNMGTSMGSWFVNIAFEGEKWTWAGAEQLLSLKNGTKKAITWSGTVPCEVPVGSVARLIAYYNDSFMPLDWWIRIIPGAQLAIDSSVVR